MFVVGFERIADFEDRIVGYVGVEFGSVSLEITGKGSSCWMKSCNFILKSVHMQTTCTATNPSRLNFSDLLII